MLVFYQNTKNMPARTFWSEPEGQSRQIFCVLVKYQHSPTFLQNVGILPEFFKVAKKMPKVMHNWPLDIDQHFDVILISKSISMMQFLRLEIDRHKIEL